MGKVYLVGAGPGNPELITVKGYKLLQNCDAVIYDRLATDELLDYVKEDCEKIYVGKEAGKHYKKQEEINEILVHCAKRHKMVVRLKGGDPFVFGRGGEEIDAMNQYGIPYEVVPGITSAVAVPECAGIPVTHRGVSRSFHVITGHTKEDSGNPVCDYKLLAKMEGTLVFLMGLSKIGLIVRELMAAGKPGTTPAAVISDGTTKYQKVVRASLVDIEQKVKEREIPSPAVIVVGETAGYEYLYQSANTRRIGITATDSLWEKLEAGFARIGMQPISLCSMQVVLEEGMQQLEEELSRLEDYQWILFTSQNAIRLFFDRMKKKKTDIRKLGGIRFAVLGSGTAEKLLEYGIKADFIPSKYMVSVMAEEFVKIIEDGERVLIPRALQGSPELSGILKKNQVLYRDIPIYDVIGKMTQNIKCLDSLDYLVFVSASGVTAFFEQLQERELTLPENIRIACIGKITQKRLLEEYGEADVVAAVSDVEGLLKAVKEYESFPGK